MDNFRKKEGKQHRLSFMYKVNSGSVPSYIQDLIPPLVCELMPQCFSHIRTYFRVQLVLNSANKVCLYRHNTILLWRLKSEILDLKLNTLLSCQPRVTVASCFVYKVIMDLSSIDRRIGLIHRLSNN